MGILRRLPKVPPKSNKNPAPMTIFLSGATYIAVCFLCRGLGNWSPLILPHCDCAARPQRALIAVLPAALVTVLGTVMGSLVGVRWWWFVDALVASLALSLILDAFRRATSSVRPSPRPSDATSSEPSEGAVSEQESSVAPYLLVCAPESELIKLEADFRVADMMGPTPFRDVRIASVEAAPAIVDISPSAAIVPWPEVLNEKIFAAHAEKDKMCKEKIAEAMAADASKMAADLENQELDRKLKEALDANRKYEKVLQDLRSRPNAPSVDYAKMTPSQRLEEEKRLKESLKKIQDLSKNPQLPHVSIPSYFRPPGSIQ